MNVEMRPIGSILPYEHNNKKHPQDQIDKIARSIKEFGFNVPILVDEHNVIIAGHGRLLAAKQLCLTEVPIIVLTKLTTAQILQYRIADNKSAESEWDVEALKYEFGELEKLDLDMTATGFSMDEINKLLGIEAEEVEADDVDTITTEIQVGDVFQIGSHRLMCGDSTDKELVWDKLLEQNTVDGCFTDPPYNTGMTGGSQKAWLSGMFKDVYTEPEWNIFMKKFTEVYFSILAPNSAAYICLDWRRNYELIPYIKSAGFHISNIIVWDKVVHGLGSDYKYTYEVINVCKKGKPVLNTHQGGTEYSDVWHIQRKLGRDDDHATKKPIELCARAIRHMQGKTICDLFGGSGSTMVACEQLGRMCYMMELDPKYCQVIINRMRKTKEGIEVKCLTRPTFQL